jgi:hypothetical protein
VYRIVRDSGGISLEEQLVTVCARYLGFNRVGPDVKTAVEKATRVLQELQWLTDTDDTRLRVSGVEE